jgi:hypothetical protein
MSFPECPNYSYSREAASLLASRIKDHWRQLGHTRVEAWVELALTDKSGHQIFAVRSNLVRGLPPRREHTR